MNSMSRGEQASFGLLLTLACLATINAQTDPSNPCYTDGKQEVNIAFFENDDGTKNDPVVIFEEDPPLVEIGFYTNRRNNLDYPFHKFFTTAFIPFNPFKGYSIKMNGTINRDGLTESGNDDVNILAYRLMCQSSSTQQHFKDLRISIVDKNDNTPQFQNAPYYTTVNELTPVGLTVFRFISATDLDEANNKVIIYSLSDPIDSQLNGSQKFYLPSSQEGRMAVLEPLDFESLYRRTGNASDTYYDIVITATDNSQGDKKSSTTTIRVLITDGDDQGPEFVYSSCLKSTETLGKRCIRAKYYSSVLSGDNNAKLLTFTTEPPLPNNDVVGIIMQDRDTLNSNIQCRIASTYPSGYVNHFIANTVQIDSSKQYRCVVSKLVNKALFRNTVPTVEIVLEAIEMSSNFRVDYAIIAVIVEQATNNAPTIVASSNLGYVYENSPKFTLVAEDVGITKVLKLTFSDLDVLATDVFEFDISVSPNVPFTITPDGYVEVAADNTLDFETQNSYRFTVTITERTPEKRTGSLTLDVNVLNLNDFPPVFTSPEDYVTSVPEGDYSNFNGARNLITVRATDGDNDVLNYSLESVFPPGNTNKFELQSSSIQPGTAVIVLKGKVSSGEQYRILIGASDQGTPERRVDTVVFVFVTPIGNQSPMFSAKHYIVYVSEGVPLRSAVFVLPVSDPDTPFDLLNFNIMSQNPNAIPSRPFFGLNGSVIQNIRLLDREFIDEYNVTVRCTDPSNNNAQTLVTVRVTDINDNDPRFGERSYVFSVNENQVQDTVFGTPVTATDIDSGLNANLVYNIVSDLDASSFRIDRISGQLRTAETFNYEIRNQYNILVEASDSGRNARTAQVLVTVNIEDLEDSVPLFEDLNYEREVQENLQDAEVITLTAFDGDLSKRYNFILEDVLGRTDASIFRVATVGDQAVITVNGALDYETQNVYMFLVTTDDGANTAILFSSATVTVAVLDLNDNSPRLQPYDNTETLLETVALQTLIEDITATDQDTSINGMVRYEIADVKPENGRDLFFVNYITGQLRVGNSLAAERSINDYTVVVRAFDLAITQSRSVNATILINIVRNLPPEFGTFGTDTMTISPKVRGDLSVVINKIIVDVSALDPNEPSQPEFATVKYYLEGNGDASFYFDVGLDNGIVRLRQSIDGQSTEQYVLRIVARDLPGLTDIIEVTVPIERNLFEPVVNPTIYNPDPILQNEALGIPILRVRGSDNDFNAPWNELVYTLVQDGTVERYFQIDSNGDLSLRASLATTKQSTFIMTVRVSDKGTVANPARQAAVPAIITIQVNRNELDPVFFNETYRVNILETNNVGSEVVTVAASDGDTIFNNLQYFLLGNDEALEFFQLDQQTSVRRPGRINIKKPLGTALLNDYMIAVEAQDNGQPPRTANAYVFVHIIRSFNPPRWASNVDSFVIVEEDIGIGVGFTTISVQIPSTNTRYRIVSGDKFQVNNNGDVSARQPLFWDDDTSYIVRFEAYNAGDENQKTPEFILTVNPIRNLFAPKFLSTPYNFVIRTLPIADNQVVGNIIAEDRDTIFSIMKFTTSQFGDEPTLLTLTKEGNDQAQIRIPNAATITQSAQDVFRFYAVVQDNGAIPKYDVTLVTVTINRNRNAPNFPVVDKTARITEDTMVGSLIESCPATDSDSDGISYFLDQSEPFVREYFSVSSDGQIILVRDLKLDTVHNEYNVVITATDTAKYPSVASNTCTVIVSVARNDNAPRFVDLPYDRIVEYTAQLNDVIVRVSAVDDDTEVRGLTCEHPYVSNVELCVA